MTSLEPHTAPVALSREAVEGRTTGALFFIGFGAVWVLLGCMGMHRATLPVVLLLTFVVAALLATSTMLYRVARGLPSGNIPPERMERARRMFTAVNIIQWTSVLAAVFILGVLHHPDYIAPAIAIIVGLHLIPLAQSFHYRQHHITAALLVLWSLACMALFHGERLPALSSLGTGVILLGSATITLLRCLPALHRKTHTTLANAREADSLTR